MRILLAILFLGFSTFTLALETKEDLIKMHYDFIATIAGKSYEMIAVSTFWGDASFMQTCVPQDAPLPESFDILYKVKSNGSVSDIYLFPETEIGKCIKQHVKTREFNNPPHEFVGYIRMIFNQ
jgi:hypothetical protein